MRTRLAQLPVRLRLTLWYLLVFAVAQASFSVGAAIWMHRSLNAGAMDDLRSQTKEITDFLVHEPAGIFAGPSGIHAEKLTADLHREFGDEPEGQWLRILLPGGRALAVTPQAAAITHPFHDGEQVTLRIDHHRARFLASRVEAHGQAFLIETGVTVDAASAAIERFRQGLWLLSPALLLLAAAGSYWISRKALRPVDELTRAARGITDSNLHQRLPVAATGDELSRLSETLNEMLARIESAFQRVRQFTADASHELRTPVSLIRTEAEIALRRDRSAQQYRDALHQISLEAARTGSLLESMLTLARADAGEQRPKLAVVDCAAMLRELAHDWTGWMSDAAISLELSIAAGTYLLNADAFALRRMFVILLDNARKYTPPGGAVALRARTLPEGRIEVEVEDSGIGIAPEHLPHVFDRFYRADAARNRTAGGVGLGLALARRIAEQHAAELTVHSTFGHGSRFVVTLPAHDVDLTLAASDAHLTPTAPDVHQTSQRESGPRLEVPHA